VSTSLSPKRKLIADTGTPTAEIVAIDATGNVQARGIGRLEAELTPGIYKIRYRIGNRVVDKLEELPFGDGAWRVSAPELPLDSPAPLMSSSGVSPANASFARDWNHEVHVRHGTGSKVFIFVSTPQNSPGLDIELRTFKGEQLATLALFRKTESCSGCTIELNPGIYLLRARDGDGVSVERTVVASGGWQTQLFIPVAEQEQKGTWYADLSESALLMPRLEVGFEPSVPDFRWAEAARQALASGRAVTPNDQMMRALFNGKFDDPILGIFAGHLLAAQPDPPTGSEATTVSPAEPAPSAKTSLLAEVVSNLQRLIGDHPDVTTLLFRLADANSGNLQYSEPPMLRSSWALILKSSTPQRDPRPPGSYSARVASGLWGSGAWLVWRTPPEPVEELATEGTTFDWQQLFAVAESEELSSALSRADLTPTEFAVLSVIHGSARQVAVARNFASLIDANKPLSKVYPLVRKFITSDIEKTAKQRVAEVFHPENLTAVTGIPYSSIEEAGVSLSKKLGVQLQKTGFSGLMQKVRWTK